MLAKVCSAAVNGIEAYPVEVEVNAGYGDTIIVIVGLPDAAVKESRDRVMTALINSGFSFTFGRTTINLAPADVKKEGPSFDLPIAIGMVAASEQMESDQLENFVMVGELALNGAVRMVKGVLPIALRARSQGKVGILVPPENAAEAAVVTGLQVIPVRNLREAVAFLEGEVKLAPTKVDMTRVFDNDHEDEVDFAEVKGQESVMRDARPVHEIGEFAEPVLIWVGSIILAIPFQEVEGIQHVAYALTVEDEVARNFVGTNHNRRGQPNQEALAIDAVDLGSSFTDQNTATIELLLHGPSRVFEQPFGLLFVNRVQ